MDLGKVELKLVDVIKKDGAGHLTLIDPYEKIELNKKIAQAAEGSGSDAIMIGGSLGGSDNIELTINEIKKITSLPIILFPGNVDFLSKKADAIWFMSLLNSRNPYWHYQAQALGAPVVKSMGLEPIPLAYVIVDPGQNTSVGWIADVNPIPRNKEDIISAYALASSYLGFRWIYIEAGSGSGNSVPIEMIASVKKSTTLNIITGGGINTPKEAAEKIKAGADFIVTGTVLEKSKDPTEILSQFVEEIKKAGKSKL